MTPHGMERALNSPVENLLKRKKLIERIDSLNQKAFTLAASDPAESLKTAETAESLSRGAGYSKGTARASHTSALYHLRSGDLQSAVKKSREALEIYTELDDTDGVSSTLNTLGIAFRNIGSFDRGLDCFMKSLKIESKRNKSSNLVKLYGNIGNIFDSMGQYSDGLQYYLKCLAIAEELDEETVKADAYGNLGTCYHHLGEYDRSVKSHRKALKIKESLGDELGISFCLNNLGMIYEHQHKYQRALKYYLRSLDIKIKLNMKLETARACNTVGSLYTVIGEFENASAYLEKGLKLAKEVNSQTALRENHMCLSNLKRATGDFEAALRHHMEFHRLDKQIFNSTRIASMEAQLEIMNSEVYSANRKLEQANSKLSTLSVTDGLTGIYNRRRFEEFLETEWNRCKRRSACVSILMIDIDFFKLYNDTYGHITGDECLRAVAGALNSTANRSTDLVARYGGEEFVIVLSETDSSGAVNVARAAATAVKTLGIPHSASRISDRITVSMGLASLTPVRGMHSVQLVNRADKALYFSKKQGRNRITMYEN